MIKLVSQKLPSNYVGGIVIGNIGANGVDVEIVMRRTGTDAKKVYEVTTTGAGAVPLSIASADDFWSPGSYLITVTSTDFVDYQITIGSDTADALILEIVSPLDCEQEVQAVTFTLKETCDA